MPSFRTCILFLLATLLVAACGASAGDPTNADQTSAANRSETEAGDAQTNQTEDTAVPANAVPDDAAEDGEAIEPDDAETSSQTSLEGSLLAPSGRVSNWSGVIGDDIDVSLWLAQNGSFIFGQMTYVNVGDPIVVLGRTFPSSDAYFLNEFGADGRVSGSFTLSQVNNGVITGATWGDLPFELRFENVSRAPFFFDPLVRPGNYRYSFAPFGENGDVCCGPVGNLQISNVTSDSITVAFANVGSGPGFNQAIIDTIEIPLKDNVATFERTDSDFIDCAFAVTVFDGFAFVQHIDDRFDCGFGNAAGVEGHYLRTE